VQLECCSVSAVGGALAAASFESSQRLVFAETSGAASIGCMGALAPIVTSDPGAAPVDRRRHWPDLSRLWLHTARLRL
jgi:hypothetical protein